MWQSKNYKIAIVVIMLLFVGCKNRNVQPKITAEILDTITLTPISQIPKTFTTTPTLTPTFTLTPTKTDIPTKTPRPTKTPIIYNYVTLGELYNVPALISANDAYNGLWIPGCSDANHSHFDLSPSHMGNGDLTVKSPVSGEISIFNPFGDDRWEGANITLPRYTLINGIENAFAFSGYDFDPTKVNRVWVGLGHIIYSIPYDKNDSSIDGKVTIGQSLGEMSYDTMSKIGWITAYKVYVQYMLEGQSIELVFSPDLFEHEPWECNPSSPYDCEPEVFDYKPGCIPD